jgi:hypothetical protein
MSHYLVQPVAFISLLEQQADYLQDMDAPLASQLLMATESLLTVLQRHLSYNKPTQFNIPIPFIGPYHDTLIWLAHKTPEVDPTSMGAQGMHTGKQFCWNSNYKHYKIMLDDLNLEDLGILDCES